MMVSVKAVDEGRLGQLAEGVVESGGGDVVAAEAVGAADDDLELVVETLDGTGGDGPAGAEPVEDEVGVLLEGPGDAGEGFELGAPGAAAPADEEEAGAAGLKKFQSWRSSSLSR